MSITCRRPMENGIALRSEAATPESFHRTGVTSMILKRSHLAHRFAQELAESLITGSLSHVLQSAPPFEEHKSASADIMEFLTQFLNKQKINVKECEILFDWEGNQSRTWPQSHSYPLLGTYAHPDAAVLSPFTCALEFDRARKQSVAFFKQALLKASVHVLSGAYDAALLVFISPMDSNPEQYLKDGSPHTQQILQQLQVHGLYTTFVSVGTQCPATESVA